MSTKLALSSALSIMLMAGFALLGPQALGAGAEGQSLFGPAPTAKLQPLPLLPLFPGLR